MSDDLSAEDALSDDEEIISSFRPHWKLLFIPLLWFIGLATAAILGAVYLGGPYVEKPFGSRIRVSL